MSARFSNQRCDLLWSSCTFAGAAAVVLPDASLHAFAAGSAMPLPHSHGTPLTADALTVSSDKVPADMKNNPVEGIVAHSAACAHLGCMFSNWEAAMKQFLGPCQHGRGRFAEAPVHSVCS